MATFHFDLVSPEKLLFSGDVDQVDVPGSEGDFGVLAGHAPLVTHAAAGHPRRLSRRRRVRVVVNGGFAEVSPAGLTVLADMAVPQDEFDPALLAGVIKDTEEDAAAATDDWRRDKLSHKARSVEGAAGRAAIASSRRALRARLRRAKARISFRHSGARPQGASPESILTAVVMDSGLLAIARAPE